jgi:hypothetical protein
MEYDEYKLKRLQKLIETLGGVNLEIMNGSPELLEDFMQSRSEIQDRYEKSTTMMQEIFDFGMYLIKITRQERGPLLMKMVDDGKLDVVMNKFRQYVDTTGHPSDHCHTLLVKPLCWLENK